MRLCAGSSQGSDHACVENTTVRKRGSRPQSPTAPGQSRAHAARGRRTEARLLEALAALPPSPARITGAGRAAPWHAGGHSGGALGEPAVPHPQRSCLGRPQRPHLSHSGSSAGSRSGPAEARVTRSSELHRLVPPAPPRPGVGAALRPPDLSRPAPPPTRSRRRLHVRSVVLNLAPLSPPRPLRWGRSRGYPEEGSRPGSWAAGSSVPSSTLMAHGLQVTGGGVGLFSGHTPRASGCPGHFPVCNGNHWTTWERDGTWASFTTPLSIARGYAARVTSTGTWA